MTAPSGLFCADGARGVFERRTSKREGSDACGRCGVLAWKHWTVKP